MKTPIMGRTLGRISALFLVAAAFILGDVTISRGQEQKQAVNTQIKFICSENRPVAAYDEFATVKASIGDRPLQSLLTYNVPIGTQVLKVVTQPPVGTWFIREIKFVDMSDHPLSQTFTPQTPEATVSLNIGPRYGTSISRLEITVDQCGGPGASSNAVRILEPEKPVPWCKGQSGMSIVTEEAPQGVPQDAAMVVVKDGDLDSGGQEIRTLPINQLYVVKQGTSVHVPPGSWRVKVALEHPPSGMVQHLILESDGSFHFPCRRDPTAAELLELDIELSGGLYEWVRSGFPATYTNLYKLRVMSLTDRANIRDTFKGRRVSLPAKRDLNASESSHHRRAADNLAGSRVRVEIRPNQGTLFTVHEGEYEVEPEHGRSFILRAGQQVRVTRGSVSAIREFKSAAQEIARVAVRTKKPNYSPNERIEVEYANPAGHDWDFITIARPSDGDQSDVGSSSGNKKWRSYVDKERRGTKAFEGLAEGQYEARYISWDGGYNRATARSPFTVGNAASSTGGSSSVGNPPATGDLSGLWVDDTGGGAIYRLRQVGNKVYWGVDAVSKGSFANVYHGEVSGKTINGKWVDVPGSPSLSGGEMALRIESICKLVKVSSSNYYGAQVWTKQGADCQVVGLTQRTIPRVGKPKVEEIPDDFVVTGNPPTRSRPGDSTSGGNRTGPAKPQVEEIPDETVTSNKPPPRSRPGDTGGNRTGPAKPRVEEIPEEVVENPKPPTRRRPADPNTTSTGGGNQEGRQQPPTRRQPTGQRWTLVSVTVSPENPPRGGGITWDYNAQSSSALYALYNGDKATFQWTPPPQEIDSDGFTVSVGVQANPAPNSRVATTIGVSGSGLTTETPSDQQSANVLAETTAGASAQQSVTFTPARDASEIEVKISMQWAITFTYKYRRAQ